MPAQQKPFHLLDHTPDLILSLVSASSAIAALDARVSASLVAPAWKRRASWTGYAAALRLQNEPFEEIDVIGHLCDIIIPARVKSDTTGDVFAEYEQWATVVLSDAPRAQLRGEGALFAPDVPPLVRALSAVDLAARADKTMRPWLALPSILSELRLTHCALPCLVVGDHGQRFAREPRMVVLRRLLSLLKASAENGIERLNELERLRQKVAQAVCAAPRAGRLAQLGPILVSEAAVTPSRVARSFGMSRAGAGKLLERAASLELAHEVSGRNSWKVFLARDVALTLGMVIRERGRPKAIDLYNSDLVPALSAFDKEMAEIDQLLAGSKSRVR